MVNLNRPWGQFDLLAVPRQVIGSLALHLDSRILRWDLLDQPGEAGQQRRNRLRRRAELTGFDDLALGVVGVALLAPAHRETVALAAVHHEGDGLGGFAERNRQAA